MSFNIRCKKYCLYSEELVPRETTDKIFLFFLQFRNNVNHSDNAFHVKRVHFPDMTDFEELLAVSRETNYGIGGSPAVSRETPGQQS